jgi:predicted transcriptional regulator
MSISEVMSNCVNECTEDAPLEQVYELILKCKHGLVVVIDSQAHRVPIGVVSERSICEQLIVRGKTARSLTAGSVLDPRIRTVRLSDPLKPLTVEEKESLAAIIVTNENRQVCGIVPKDAIATMPSPVAETHSAGQIYVNTSVRSTPASREIPAFGWIQ